MSGLPAAAGRLSLNVVLKARSAHCSCTGVDPLERVGYSRMLTGMKG